MWVKLQFFHMINQLIEKNRKNKKLFLNFEDEDLS